MDTMSSYVVRGCSKSSKLAGYTVTRAWARLALERLAHKFPECYSLKHEGGDSVFPPDASQWSVPHHLLP